MTTEPDHLQLDMDRFPFESRKAIEAGETLVELLDPGSLCAAPGDGVVRLLADGREIGVIPLYRLTDIDIDMLVAAVKDAVGMLPSHQADQLSAAGRDGRLTAFAPVDAEHVAITVADDPTAAGIIVHRSRCCPGWPDDTAEDPQGGGGAS